MQTQITSAAPGDIRYRDRRLLVLYFDMTAMGGADRCARSGPRRSSSGRRWTVGLMAVMAFQGGAVRVKQDFTDDRARLDEVPLR